MTGRHAKGSFKGWHCAAEVSERCVVCIFSLCLSFHFLPRSKDVNVSWIGNWAVGVSAGCKWWPCYKLMTCPGCEPAFAQRRRESRIKDNKKWDQIKFQRHVVRLFLKWNYLVGGEHQSFRADLFCMKGAKKGQDSEQLWAAAGSMKLGFMTIGWRGKWNFFLLFCRFAMFLSSSEHVEGPTKHLTWRRL